MQLNPQTINTVQELYLYPHNGKVYAAVHTIVLGLSWSLGLIFSAFNAEESLGAAYFIFSLSLLLEFEPQKRIEWLSFLLFGIFYSLVLVIAGLSFFAMIGHSSKTAISVLQNITNVIMVIVIINTLFRCFLAPLILHSPPSDEERRQTAENRPSEDKEIFMKCLTGEK